MTALEHLEKMEVCRADRDATLALIEAFDGPAHLRDRAGLVALDGSLASLQSDYDDARRLYAEARGALERG